MKFKAEQNFGNSILFNHRLKGLLCAQEKTIGKFVIRSPSNVHVFDTVQVVLF